MGGLHLLLSLLDSLEPRNHLHYPFSFCFSYVGLHSMPYMFLVLSYLRVFARIISTA